MEVSTEQALTSYAADMTTESARTLAGRDHLGAALAKETHDNGWLDLEVELISGGKSNLTYTVTSRAGQCILRRPPEGPLLPTAHDMMREARVQRALAGSAVPVARVVMVDRGDLLGVPSYVMEKVEGHVIRDRMPPAYAETPEQRLAMSYAFADTLAHLHAIDPEAVGLGDYGRPDGFMDRQVRRWTAQWEKSRFDEVPEVEELGRRLARAVPEQSRSTIIHGDYRLDNVVYHPADPGVINAVLDWELSTLGDPMTDLGLLMLFWRDADEGPLSIVPGVSHLPGFATRSQMLERYATTSGDDVSSVEFHQAFAHFKFAAIVQGVHARSRAGAMGGQDFGDLGEHVRALGAAGLHHL